MIGITGYGAYLPRYRMDRSVLTGQVGWFNRGMGKGEKAVANHDEDAVTMAHAAAKCCQADKQPVDALYLASLSFPYQVRQNAVIVASALGLDAHTRTADYTSSLQCGAQALLAGIDAVAAGSVQSALVCSADARAPKPSSPQDYTWGDGAAALRVGKENVIAQYLGSSAVAADFIDKWLIDSEKFEHSWEDRWVRDEGHLKLMPKAMDDLFHKTGTTMQDYQKVCIACPSVPATKALSKRYKIAPEQLVDNMVGPVGDTGSAMAGLMLAAALESANPGDKILLVTFGSGAQAVAFAATDAIAAYGNKGCLARTMARKAPLTEYVRYLAYKGLVDMEVGIRGELASATAMSVLHQQGAAVSSLEGGCCSACGTIQFPKHEVCVNPQCNGVGKMELYLFSDKHGKVSAFTADGLAFSWNPPQLDGMIDFQDGGRIFMDFTDCTREDIQVGAKMEMTFRRKYSDSLRGYYGYFWKAMPVKE